MPGFAAATFDYLRDLSANNSRDWFEANRDRYETHWRSAALEFIEAARPVMAALTPPHKAEARLNGSLRRINRDTRFSKDKTPYHPMLHMVFWSGTDARSPALHFVLQPDGVGYGVGQWDFSPTRLAAYRAALRGKAREGLERALAQAATVGCTLDDATLKRLPAEAAGYDGDPALMLRKMLVVRTMAEPAPATVLHGPDALDWLNGTARALVPVNVWLSQLDA